MSDQSRVASPALPSADTVLRSVRPHVLAYAATLASAVFLILLLLLALAVDADSIDDQTGVSDEDADGWGVVLGMPFQLTAMALFGSLHVGGEDASISLFALPMALTAVFAFVTAALAAREELACPSRDAQAKFARAALGAGVTSVLVTVLTRVFAMRDEGVALHAATVGLFLGTLMLGLAAGFLGRAAAGGVRRPPWLSADVAKAATLWGQHVCVWLVAALPVLFVYTLVDSGVGPALAAPIWAPTAALFTYAFGHLAPATAGPEQMFAWEDSVPAALVMVALALVLNAAAAAAWHLRRDRRPEWLREPASWLALPVTFAVGGLLLTLLGTLRLSGNCPWSAAAPRCSRRGGCAS